MAAGSGEEGRLMGLDFSGTQPSTSADTDNLFKFFVVLGGILLIGITWARFYVSLNI